MLANSLKYVLSQIVRRKGLSQHSQEMDIPVKKWVLFKRA